MPTQYILMPPEGKSTLANVICWKMYCQDTMNNAN
jgi:hypothetical protein